MGINAFARGMKSVNPRAEVKVKVGASGLDDAPDILLMLTDKLAAIDNLSGRIGLIVYADPGPPNAYGTAHDRLHQLRRRLRQPVEIPFPAGTMSGVAKARAAETVPLGLYAKS